MKQIENNNSKYSELLDIVATTAEKCKCTRCYVRKIINGERVATPRAVKAQRVTEVLDEFLEAYNSRKSLTTK